MAAFIAGCRGDDKQEVTRLGHRCVKARVATYNIFVNVALSKDNEGGYRLHVDYRNDADGMTRTLADLHFDKNEFELTE